MFRSVIAVFTATAAAMSATACETTASAQPVEATLISSSPQTTAALSDAVSKMLGGRPATLAPNVLMSSSKLVMDPKFVDQRSFQRPDHFTLVKAGQSCLLRHDESGQEVRLVGVSCQAL